MGERISTAYKQLFEVRLLHHYWLDEGLAVFDSLPDEKKNKHLLLYDSRDFFSVVATAACAQVLQGLHCLFTSTALGFTVAAPQTVFIPDDTVLEFVLTIRQEGFFNYTALTLPKRKISEVYNQPENKVYRYKENVFVLSNLTGIKRNTGTGSSLFLSKQIPMPSSDDKAESLVLSGNALLQLTGDQPGAATQQLYAQAEDVPVFVHQGDVPDLVPPDAITGAPERGVLLSGDTPDNVFALIRIAVQKPGDADYSCTQNNRVKDTGPVFHIHFKNRSTMRTYYNKNTGALISVQPEPLPMTRYGNAGTKQKPSENIKVLFDENDVNRIREIVSEIFE